jgi:uncharacterized protein (TIGR02597 family)
VRYQVLDNSEDTLVLDTAGDDLTAHPAGAVAVGDIIRVRPSWSVGTVFGNSEAGTPLQAHASNAAATDSIRFFDNSTIALNKPASLEVSFVSGLGWRSTGDATTDRADTPFRLGEPIVIHRFGSSGLALPVVGYVLPLAQSVLVAGGSTVSGTDNYVSWLFPEPASLDNSGLHDPANPAGSVVGSALNPLVHGDELLAFGQGVGFDRAPERCFYYLNGLGWQEFGTDSSSMGSQFLLEAGKAYIIRKAPGKAAVDWMQIRGN